jgi:hypothetical protein
MVMKIGPRKTEVDPTEAELAADGLFERGTVAWAAAYGAMLEMWRMMEMGPSYLGGRPGEREAIARKIGKLAEKAAKK